MKRYYLAYGSNLNILQMKHRCPNARVVGKAVIPDYELLFKGSKTGSYLTIEPMEGSEVPVGVWSVTAEDERHLDCYEGFPAFYYKVEMPITYEGIETGKRRTVKAFVYIMHEDHPYGLPSTHYLRTCAQGYELFGFDPKHLIEAYDRTQQRGEWE